MTNTPIIVSVQCKPTAGRKLKCGWSVESHQDLMFMHNISFIDCKVGPLCTFDNHKYSAVLLPIIKKANFEGLFAIVDNVIRNPETPGTDAFFCVSVSSNSFYATIFTNGEVWCQPAYSKQQFDLSLSDLEIIKRSIDEHLSSKSNNESMQ